MSNFFKKEKFKKDMITKIKKLNTEKIQIYVLHFYPKIKY